MYLSQCVAVSGVKGSRSEVLKFLIGAIWNVVLFELVKSDVYQGTLITSSGLSTGRIMVFYLQKLVIFACFLKL